MCDCTSDTGSAGGGGGGGSGTAFRYVATGAEPNPFTVALPSPRGTTNYNVLVTMGGPAANPIKVVRTLVATYTLFNFQVELSAAVTAGDIFQFIVLDE